MNPDLIGAPYALTSMVRVKGKCKARIARFLNMNDGLYPILRIVVKGG